MIRYVVLAFDRMDFQTWCYENEVDPTDAYYVSGDALLRGLNRPDAEVAQTYQFRNRRDARQILREAYNSRAKGYLNFEF